MERRLHFARLRRAARLPAYPPNAAASSAVMGNKVRIRRPASLLRRGAAVALRITRHHTAFAGVADEINADVELGGQYGQHLAHLVDR